MTEERTENVDRNSGDDNSRAGDDRLVSATYKTLQDEVTPDRINRKVLDLAARELTTSKPGGGIFAIWMKPVAWAATIGLSLAIVLQVAELQPPSESVSGSPATEPVLSPDSVAESFEPRDADILEDAREMSRSRIGAMPETAQSPDQLVSTVGEARVVDLEQFAEEAKRKRDSFAAPAGAQAQPVNCSDAARQQAESWLSCIERLRETGYDAAADTEFDAFAEQFPLKAEQFNANK